MTAAGTAGTWLVAVVTDAWQFARSNRIVATDRTPDELARPVAAAVEKRATAVSTGNVLVYSSERIDALGPFVGSGQRLHSWRLGVSASSGAARPDRGRAVPRPIDLIDLHDAIAAHAEDLHIPHLRHRYRIYADGRSLNDTPELLPDPAGPPAAVVDEATVRRRLRNPLPHQETYICVWR